MKNSNRFINRVNHLLDLRYAIMQISWNNIRNYSMQSIRKLSRENQQSNLHVAVLRKRKRELQHELFDQVHFFSLSISRHSSQSDDSAQLPPTGKHQKPYIHTVEVS